VHVVQVEAARVVLRDALRVCRGNVAAAARLVRMNRTQFYNTLERYGLHRPRVRGNAAWHALSDAEEPPHG
jgi:DNA-binding NtrC family response regulator